jgi:hypothetical protein
MCPNAMEYSVFSPAHTGVRKNSGKQPNKSRVLGCLYRQIAWIHGYRVMVIGNSLKGSFEKDCFFGKCGNIGQALTIGAICIAMTACGAGGGISATGSPTPGPGPGATGSATLIWTAPSTNTDGTSVSLASFNVYSGTSPATLAYAATAAGNTTSYTVTGLPAGTYYFAVTAVSTTGAESAMSSTGSKTIF